MCGFSRFETERSDDFQLIFFLLSFFLRHIYSVYTAGLTLSNCLKKNILHSLQLAPTPFGGGHTGSSLKVGKLNYNDEKSLVFLFYFIFYRHTGLICAAITESNHHNVFLMLNHFILQPKFNNFIW